MTFLIFDWEHVNYIDMKRKRTQLIQKMPNGQKSVDIRALYHTSHNKRNIIGPIKQIILSTSCIANASPSH